MSAAFPELEAFMVVLNQAVDYCMETQVRDAAVSNIQKSVYENVYFHYTPKVYERKYDNGGLLDPANITTDYDYHTKTLTAEDLRVDWEPTKQSHYGRNVAEVVETGEGYDFKQLGPRPFHKPAETALRKEADSILSKFMTANLRYWSL